MKKPNIVLLFLRRNALYLVLAFCIIAIGLSVTLVLVKNSLELEASYVEKEQENQQEQGEQEQPNEEPQKEQVSFIIPVQEYSSVTEYSDAMVFNSTLNRYSSHKAVDFFAEEGTNVYAVYDGTIESVDTTLLTGVTLVIDHGDGIKTVYNSITDTDDLVVGAKVKKGDIIGSVSVTNRQEYKEGAHLHFAVKENNVYIDPVKYLELNNK